MGFTSVKIITTATYFQEFLWMNALVWKTIGPLFFMKQYPCLIETNLHNSKKSKGKERKFSNRFLRQTLNRLAKLVSLAKWLSVRLQTKRLWVRIPLLLLKLQIWRLLPARSSLTFRQLKSVDYVLHPGGYLCTWKPPQGLENFQNFQNRFWLPQVWSASLLGPRRKWML